MRTYVLQSCHGKAIKYSGKKYVTYPHIDKKYQTDVSVTPVMFAKNRFETKFKQMVEMSV